MTSEIQKHEAAAAAHTAAAQAHTAGEATAREATVAAMRATHECLGMAGFDAAIEAVAVAQDDGDATPEHERAVAEHEAAAAELAAI